MTASILIGRERTTETVQPPKKKADLTSANKIDQSLLLPEHQPLLPPINPHRISLTITESTLRNPQDQLFKKSKAGGKTEPLE